MEQKLSKGQVKVIMFLEQQKEDARKLYNEFVEAEQEQLSMIAKYYNLPVSSSYSLKQHEDGLAIFSEEMMLSPQQQSIAQPQTENPEQVVAPKDKRKKE